MLRTLPQLLATMDPHMPSIVFDGYRQECQSARQPGTTPPFKSSAKGTNESQKKVLSPSGVSVPDMMSEWAYLSKKGMKRGNTSVCAFFPINRSR